MSLSFFLQKTENKNFEKTHSNKEIKSGSTKEKKVFENATDMMSVVEEKNQTEKRKASKAKDVESVKIQPSVNNTTFIDWWNYKYQTVPSNVEGEYVQGKYADRYKKTPYKYNYISNYDIDTLIDRKSVV